MSAEPQSLTKTRPSFHGSMYGHPAVMHVEEDEVDPYLPKEGERVGFVNVSSVQGTLRGVATVLSVMDTSGGGYRVRIRVDRSKGNDGEPVVWSLFYPAARFWPLGEPQPCAH